MGSTKKKQPQRQKRTTEEEPITEKDMAEAATLSESEWFVDFCRTRHGAAKVVAMALIAYGCVGMVADGWLGLGAVKPFVIWLVLQFGQPPPGPIFWQIGTLSYFSMSFISAKWVASQSTAVRCFISLFIGAIPLQAVYGLAWAMWVINYGKRRKFSPKTLQAARKITADMHSGQKPLPEWTALSPRWFAKRAPASRPPAPPPPLFGPESHDDDRLE